MNEANLVVVGGPISAGKSSLANSLPFPQVPELNENDELQDIILAATYDKKRVAPEVIESYFLEIRKNKYKKYSSLLQTHVLDRSIFESLWFAKSNMSKKSFEYFKTLWKSEIVELIVKEGKPKVYILLTMSWDTFKHRIYKRGREEEVNNFAANEEFFKKHIAEYEAHMIDVFKMFDLNYVVIQTDNLNKEQVLEEALKVVENV